MKQLIKLSEFVQDGALSFDTLSKEQVSQFDNVVTAAAREGIGAIYRNDVEWSANRLLDNLIKDLRVGAGIVKQRKQGRTFISAFAIDNQRINVDPHTRDRMFKIILSLMNEMISS